MDSRHPPVRLRFPSQPEGWRGETTLTRVALETFARRAWLNPAAWLKLAELGLSSGGTSYLETLRLLSACFAMAASSRATMR